MRSGTPGFSAHRLVEARDARGLTQVALANLINRTSSSISRWESGNHSPEPEPLNELANALNLPASFFLLQPQNHGQNPMFFRSMATTTQWVRKRTQARMRWAQDISLALQEWVDLPKVTVPCIDVHDHRQIRDSDIEAIASECRDSWGLGIGPIEDMLLVLENAGIVVVKEEVGTAKMDGLSNWSKADNRPYVLIAQDKDTCVRSRMDAAHELGHLVLHRNLTGRTLNNAVDFKEIEKQAFDFAGAFLMPAETFPAEIFSPSLNALLALKKRWKVSVGAMIMRCVSLNIVSDEYKRRLWKYYGSRGWRKKEPLDDELTTERPRILERSVRLLIENDVCTREMLLGEFRLHAADVESLCGLPWGYMTTEAAEVVELPKLKKSVPIGEDRGSVVPFTSNGAGRKA